MPLLVADWPVCWLAAFPFLLLSSLAAAVAVAAPWEGFPNLGVFSFKIICIWHVHAPPPLDWMKTNRFHNDFAINLKATNYVGNMPQGFGGLMQCLASLKET